MACSEIEDALRRASRPETRRVPWRSRSSPKNRSSGFSRRRGRPNDARPAPQGARRERQHLLRLEAQIRRPPDRRPSPTQGARAGERPTQETPCRARPGERLREGPRSEKTGLRSRPRPGSEIPDGARSGGPPSLPHRRRLNRESVPRPFSGSKRRVGGGPPRGLAPEHGAPHGLGSAPRSVRAAEPQTGPPSVEGVEDVPAALLQAAYGRSAASKGDAAIVTTGRYDEAEDW